MSSVCVYLCACVRVCCPSNKILFLLLFPCPFPSPPHSPENQTLFESFFSSPPPLPAPSRLVFIALQRQCHTFSYKEAEVKIDRSQTVELPQTLASDEAMTVWCTPTCRI